MKIIRNGITGSTLKIIATITMLLDHTAAVLLDQYLIQNGFFSISIFNIGKLSTLNEYIGVGILVLVFRMIGRIALPIYVFLLVEGFCHTKDIKAYMTRMYIFAFLSEIPFDLANCGKWISFQQQNVFWGLAIGLSVLYLYQRIDRSTIETQQILSLFGIPALAAMLFGLISGAKWGGRGILDIGNLVTIVLYLTALLISICIYLIKRRKSSVYEANLRFAKLLVMVIGMGITIAIRSDYYFGIVVSTSVLYHFRKKRIKAAGLGILSLILADPSELTAILGLIPIAAYNGKRGLQMKYFFYIFYPGHLLILTLIRFVLFFS